RSGVGRCARGQRADDVDDVDGSVLRSSFSVLRCSLKVFVLRSGFSFTVLQRPEPSTQRGRYEKEPRTRTRTRNENTKNEEPRTKNVFATLSPPRPSNTAHADGPSTRYPARPARSLQG